MARLQMSDSIFLIVKMQIKIMGRDLGEAYDYPLPVNFITFYKCLCYRMWLRSYDTWQYPLLICIVSYRRFKYRFFRYIDIVSVMIEISVIFDIMRSLL